MNVIDEIVESIVSFDVVNGRPLLIAINGVDGVGKTTLANILAEKLEKKEKNVIQASIDNFAKPRGKKLGNKHVIKKDADIWYYNDAWDYDIFLEKLINPIISAKKEICLGTFSWHKDEAIDKKNISIQNIDIVLVDGVFLFNKKLVDFWDIKLFLDADLEKVMLRGIDRDAKTQEEKEAKYYEYNHCYYGGQRLYLDDVKPKTIADIVLDYNNPLAPKIIKNVIK